MPKKNEFIWTEEKITKGFTEFFRKHGRYPTVIDIDQYTLLPSLKQLQRRFGGVRQLREKLGIEITDFTEGNTRSAVSAHIGKRGLNFERAIRETLIRQFGEIFVHEQKPFSNYSGRLDFFVYGKGNNFGIDVFYAADRHSLVGCINIKERVYKNIDFSLILLQMNQEISQQQIGDFVLKKKNKLDPHIRILSYAAFRKFIQNIEPLRIAS